MSILQNLRNRLHLKLRDDSYIIMWGPPAGSIRLLLFRTSRKVDRVFLIFLNIIINLIFIVAVVFIVYQAKDIDHSKDILSNFGLMILFLLSIFIHFTSLLWMFKHFHMPVKKKKSEPTLDKSNLELILWILLIVMIVAIGLTLLLSLMDGTPFSDNSLGIPIVVMVISIAELFFLKKKNM